jgi:hypothetical protein
VSECFAPAPTLNLGKRQINKEQLTTNKTMNEKEYSSHQEQVTEGQPSPERIKKLEDSLIEAYEKVITYQEVPCKDIEGVFFAGETESSIANVADMLVGTLGLKKSND